MCSEKRPHTHVLPTSPSQEAVMFKLSIGMSASIPSNYGSLYCSRDKPPLMQTLVWFRNMAAIPFSLERVHSDEIRRRIGMCLRRS